MMEMKLTVEGQVDQTNARMKGEDVTINGIEQAGGKVTAEAIHLREEIKDLESTIERTRRRTRMEETRMPILKRPQCFRKQGEKMNG